MKAIIREDQSVGTEVFFKSLNQSTLLNILDAKVAGYSDEEIRDMMNFLKWKLLQSVFCQVLLRLRGL